MRVVQSHIDSKGKAAMVDISQKSSTLRMAKAEAVIVLPEELMKRLEAQGALSDKGPVFQTAVVAAIMASKKTHELIPMCHPLSLDHCRVEIRISSAKRIKILAATQAHDKTGVEMEALTAVSVAALTVYDMCKALSHNIQIEKISLIEKSGGKEGFKKEEN